MRSSEASNRDLVILYEEEAEEWSAYLKQIFLDQLNPQSIHCFKVGCPNDLKVATSNLTAYRCKFLVLTPGFLTALTTPKRIHLSKILQPSDEVVLLLCGVPNSDEFYKLLSVPRGIYELSSTQNAQDYLSAVISILSSGSCQPHEYPGRELCLEEYNTRKDATSDSFVESGVNDWQQYMGPREDPLGGPGINNSSTVHVLVIPNRIQCKSPSEIYMLLKDGVSLKERPEIEFLSRTEKMKVRPTIWNSQTLCVKALDLPAGPVTMNLYCGGVRIAQAEVLYYTPMEEIERLLIRTADPMEFICQAFQINSKDQLDQLLTQSLRNSLPPSGLGAFQILGSNDRTEHSNLEHGHEFPTLLHFAAKNGLENLVTLLLECPGSAQASTVLNVYGEDPRDIAEKNGFQHIQEILDKFAVTTERHRWKEAFQNNYDVQQCVEKEKEENIYEMMAECNIKSSKECIDMGENEEAKNEEDPYSLTMDDEDPYDLILPEDKKESTAIIVKRPPAPIPRPTTLQCVDNTPFIAQVFQQKTGKGTTDKICSAPKRANRPKVGENPVYDTFRPEYNRGQQQLIHLQELVKKGVLTVNEAQERFKQWQIEEKDQDAVQQEKLRKLREIIAKDRHDVEDLYDKLKIVHPSDDGSKKIDDNVCNMPAAKGQEIYSLCLWFSLPKQGLGISASYTFQSAQMN
ncbi:B-cell scaffold protein with ankyrin repeats-like isoform X2 [Chiloscyllium plagiosum]|uniref:B-cell scaffold protein with ankyrin repeats-like isoform X2 n=1 Tax=Chiloscyllium plagiosum TaxID=36176 RepID=UPI001CB85A28|nr:B-cell scaffold protein with ankyrin repeats-like isoform X2 [Chiloscyllium plagiosum]